MLHDIWTSFLSASPLDQLNLALGVLGVALMIRRKLAAFPVGLVAVSVQAAVFWQARFYADALLQGFFFILLCYGWWRWRHPGRGQVELPVTTLSWAFRGGALLAGIGLTFGWGALSAAITDAPMPYRDAFIAAFSVVGQALQSAKKLENWPVWAAVNAVAVASYAAAQLPYTAFLYAIYFVLGMIGWRAWAKARRGPRREDQFNPGSAPA